MAIHIVKTPSFFYNNPMAYKVFIDGKEGTTGLKIFERFEKRTDLEIMQIDEDKRKDPVEKARLMNQADYVFLCLPDAAAIESAQLVTNPDTKIIDASTAHRTNPDWNYGFPELEIAEDGVNLDTETINSLTVCLGIMYGVAKASAAIKAMAKAFATGVEKQLMRRALTKGAIYPIVKSVAKWFGVHMTKEVFAGFFKKAIPVVGGVIGGGLTYATFKPCCNRLKTTLNNTSLSNPEYQETTEEQKIFDEIRNGVIIDVEPEELTEVDVE